MNDLILYTTEDGKSQIKLPADQQTVWLTQLEVAELLGTKEQNISLHLKNIFEAWELDLAAVVKESLTTQIGLSREATTEESSVVQTGRRIALHAKQCPISLLRFP